MTRKEEWREVISETGIHAQHTLTYEEVWTSNLYRDKAELPTSCNDEQLLAGGFRNSLLI